MKIAPKRVFAWLLSLAAALAGATWLVYQLPSFGGVPDGARLERMRQSKRFHGTRFENSPPYIGDLSFMREMKAYFGDEVREPQFEVPVVRLSPDQLGRTVASGLRAWWLTS